MMYTIYQYMRFVLYLAEAIFIKRSRRTIYSRDIGFVHLDAIGDYVLFRNFIQVIRRSEKFKANKITFIGNQAYKDIFINFDLKYVDEIIWLDISKLNNMRNIRYRIKTFNFLRFYSFNALYCSSYSRNFYTGDRVINHLKSDIKVGYNGNFANITPWQKKISDKYYSKLIYSKADLEFEFYRNRYFFECILGETINISKPSIPIDDINCNISLPKSFALLFVGGSSQKKQWKIENYLNLAMWLNQQYNLQIVIAGGKGEENYNRTIENFPIKLYNLIGRTNLLDMIYITSKAEIVVSNETAIPHFGVSTGSNNIFVLYSGKHFGRFVPYPTEIAENFVTICHPEIEGDIDNYKVISNQNDQSFKKLDINEIECSYVKKIIIDNFKF